jgi:ABC-type sugar transport system ATPase subunit
MAGITIDRVSKRFADGSLAVNEVSLDIADGEFVVLVGPSGCGKSTLLRMVAGLEEMSGGAIVDRRAHDQRPARRPRHRHGLPDYALYPHMTVAKNISFGLKLRGTPRAEIDQRVRDAAALLGIEPADRAQAAASSPAASASASRSAGRSSASPPPSCWTSRCPTSTPSSASTCATEIKRLHERLRDDDDLRHPRPDRGDDAGRPRRA